MDHNRRLAALSQHMGLVLSAAPSPAAAGGAKCRIAICGVGGMGMGHHTNITKGDVPSGEIVGVCDVDPAKLEKHKEYGYELFTDSDALIEWAAAGNADAIVIATPHYYHTTIAIAAIGAGLNVLTEKPLSVHKADCEKVIAAYEARPDKSKIFSEMFNQRTDQTYIKMRSMIQNGEIGDLQRVNWIITNWFRTQQYYDQGGWRATWAGEGGGVLTNQCPHQLDLVQWICGMPSSVTAHVSLGKYHDIEVEDEVTAFLEYPNGATGVFITTTGEAPGTNRFEVVGTKGKLISEGGKLTHYSMSVSSTEQIKTNAPSKTETIDIDIESVQEQDGSVGAGLGGNQHAKVMENFCQYILGDVDELISPGVEGINGVELGNAMVLSGLNDGAKVSLPMDSAEMASLISKLVAESPASKEQAADFAKSASPVAALAEALATE